mgnify:CR=1 FL=1
MLEYEFESVECKGNCFSLFVETEGYQEIIRKRAAEGWRFAGWVPKTQLTTGSPLRTIDLVFERETAEQE